ncbi:MAG: hypothetical protein HZC01_02195 [Candidatus Kerfeldbacteria bacterium]|nr:hypothetical protein [Candidatus Kerfeldbacteria bacterium]
MMMTPAAYQTTVTVKGFEGTQALLELADHQIVRWPIKDLPEALTQGAVFQLVLSTPLSEEQHREELARAVLNTLLRS